MDYKIRRLVRVTPKRFRVAVQYYDGAETTETEYNPITGQDEQVTRYRRTGKIKRVRYRLLVEGPNKLAKIRRFLNQEMDGEATSLGKVTILDHREMPKPADDITQEEKVEE